MTDATDEFKRGESVVVDGTLIVSIQMRLATGNYVVETGHGTLVVAPDRIAALA